MPFDPESAERFARAAAALGRIVADHDARPAWLAGDFFGRKFAPAPAASFER